MPPVQPKYLHSRCPACGTRTLRSTTADAGGALDVDGNTVNAGDHVHACDSCSALIPAGKPAPPAKPPAKRTAKKRAKKPATKPAAKKQPAGRRPATKPAATTTRGGK